MTLIKAEVFCGPALTTAASAEQSGTMVADDNSLIELVPSIDNRTLADIGQLLCPGPGTDRQRMCLQPQGAGGSHRVNASLLPPCRFVPTAMQLAMMAATKRHCVLVADLATECLPLDKAQMMRI